MKKPITKKAKSTKTASAVAAPKPVRRVPTKKPAVKATRTSIRAHIDVGFGNALYVRGEGPGLSWDRGIMMDCVDDSQWTITLSEATKPVVFKVLLNDLTWCVGTDCTVVPGGAIDVVPVF